jgi:ketosteroid isomerase-like protein
VKIWEFSLVSPASIQLDFHCLAKSKSLIKLKEGKMKSPLSVVSLVLLLCFVFACQKQGQEMAKVPEANRDADVAAIKALLDQWVQLYNAEDFDRLVSIFNAENTTLMPPNESACKGKDAILLWYQKASGLNAEHVDSSVVEDVRVSGDLAVAWGTDSSIMTPRSGGEPVKSSYKWIDVFERQPDGTWKCICEIWNDNPLPETPEKEQQD